MSATVGKALADAAARLHARGIESARRDARLLVALATGIEDALVLAYPERDLPSDAALRLSGLLARRMAGEPISRIAGRREFWSLEFALAPETLDPRPDSETLVAAALEFIPDHKMPVRLLDLGTGSGCLLLALLSELPNAIGVGVDLVPDAARMARRNAAINHLESRAFFTSGHWGDGLLGGFDVVTVNPPYLKSAEIPALRAEVSLYDPFVALNGGADGFQAYRQLAPDLARLGRIALVEVGAGQAQSVAEIFAEAGLDEVARRRDLQGIERCLVVAPAKKHWKE
jgi:release factor glutamine methyltransferase